MRKILLLIPFLFISVKPYQQVITHNDTVKSLDTIQLVKTVDTISMEIEKSKRLDVKKNKLKEELNRLKKEKRKQAREERQLKKAMEKFNNRGI